MKLDDAYVCPVCEQGELPRGHHRERCPNCDCAFSTEGLTQEEWEALPRDSERWSHFRAAKRVPVVAQSVEAEREDWRGKAERYLSEWRNRDGDAVAAEADRDEADAAKEMWRKRALDAERELEKVISG